MTFGPVDRPSTEKNPSIGLARVRISISHHGWKVESLCQIYEALISTQKVRGYFSVVKLIFLQLNRF